MGHCLVRVTLVSSCSVIPTKKYFPAHSWEGWRCEFSWLYLQLWSYFFLLNTFMYSMFCSDIYYAENTFSYGCFVCFLKVRRSDHSQVYNNNEFESICALLLSFIHNSDKLSLGCKHLRTQVWYLDDVLKFSKLLCKIHSVFCWWTSDFILHCCTVKKYWYFIWNIFLKSEFEIQAII